MRFEQCIAAAAAFSCFAFAAGAQEAPVDLVKLRKNYNDRLSETLRTTVTDYHKQLVALENEASTSGDYAGAYAANTRAAMLTIQYAELTDGPAAGFTLEASRASTSGAVSLDRSAGVLKKFSSPGSRATWDARQSTPGTYEVFITYATPSPVDNPAYESGRSLPKTLVAGGAIKVREATSLGDASENELIAEIEPTGSWDTFETISLGTMTLNSAATSIEIVAIKAEPEGLMHLRSVRFKRVPPAISPTSSPPPRLSALRTEHTSKLNAALKPVTDTYIASLEKLASATSVSGNLDEVVAIRAEIERASKRGESTLSASDELMQDAIVLDAVDTLRVRKSDSVVASSKGYLTSLAPAGAFVEWDIQRLNLPPGFYEIGLRYRKNDKSGGTFRIASGDSSFTGSFAREENFSPNNPFHDRPWGILYLVENSASLRLTVSSILPGGNSLCDLESISLRLTDRKSFEQAEILERNRSDSQWVKLEGARFVSSGDTMAGDNVHLTHAGKKLHIRLYGADCPYTQQGGGSAANQTSRFGLNATQLEKIARDASKFTTDALKAGPFIVYTKNQSASQSGKEDRIFAFIVTQKGLLSQQLVLAGLAKVEGTFSDAPDEINPGVTAEIHQQWLREEQSKARKANRGMWKYKE